MTEAPKEPSRSHGLCAKLIASYSRANEAVKTNRAANAKLCRDCSKRSIEPRIPKRKPTKSSTPAEPVEALPSVCARSFIWSILLECSFRIFRLNKTVAAAPLTESLTAILTHHLSFATTINYDQSTILAGVGDSLGL